MNLLILLKKTSIDRALLILYVTTKTHFLLQKKRLRKFHACSCQNECDALTFLLDNFFILLAPSCIDKKLEFIEALIVLPWLLIYFVIRGTL